MSGSHAPDDAKPVGTSGGAAPIVGDFVIMSESETSEDMRETLKDVFADEERQIEKLQHRVDDITDVNVRFHVCSCGLEGMTVQFWTDDFEKPSEYMITGCLCHDHHLVRFREDDEPQDGTMMLD
jgi:hypothetical protein